MPSLSFPLLLLIVLTLLYFYMTELWRPFTSMGLKKWWVAAWFGIVYIVGLVLWLFL